MSTNEMHEKETLKVENTKAQMRKGVLEMYLRNNFGRGIIHHRYYQ